MQGRNANTRSRDGLPRNEVSRRALLRDGLATQAFPHQPARRSHVFPALILLLCLSAFATGQDAPQADPRIVEAAFLRNFARYVTWPDNAFGDAHSPWRICIVGGDPFGDALERTLAGRMEQGRPFKVSRIETPDMLHHCQIVYVAFEVSANRRATLAQLRGRPILTVSNAPGFLREGGIIRFDVSDYVAMSINLDQARAASLTIQTKMLEVSNDVLENGVMRKVR